MLFYLLVSDNRVIFTQKSCVQRRSVTEHMIAVAYNIIMYCFAEEACLCFTNEEWLNRACPECLISQTHEHCEWGGCVGIYVGGGVRYMYGAMGLGGGGGAMGGVGERTRLNMRCAKQLKHISLNT